MKLTSIIFSETETKYLTVALKQLQENIKEIPCNDTKGMNEDIINIDGILNKIRTTQFEEPKYLTEE